MTRKHIHFQNSRESSPSITGDGKRTAVDRKSCAAQALRLLSTPRLRRATIQALASKNALDYVCVCGGGGRGELFSPCSAGSVRGDCAFRGARGIFIHGACCGLRALFVEIAAGDKWCWWMVLSFFLSFIVGCLCFSLSSRDEIIVSLRMYYGINFINCHMMRTRELKTVLIRKQNFT